MWRLFVLTLIPCLVIGEPLKFPESSSDDSASSSSNADQARRDATNVIEEILSASRAGRNVSLTVGNTDLTDLARDPELKKKLEVTAASSVSGRSNLPVSSGPDNVEARNYVSNKLCALGLARCGQQRNNYGIPDVTLVQPVQLKPVGEKILAIPVSSGGGRPYKSYDRPNGVYPSESQGGFSQNGNYGCTCVPVNQCNSYDIQTGPSNTNTYPPQYNPSGNRYPSGNYNNGNFNNGNFNNGNYNNGNYNNGNYNNGNNNNYNNGNYNNGFITGNGRPNYGQVGQGIDPRNKLDGNIESNATVVEAPTAPLDARSVPESAAVETTEKTRARRDIPRVVNGGSSGCGDRQVCCRNPVRPADRGPSYPSPSGSGNGNYQSYPQQNNFYQGQNGGGGGGGGVCGKRNAYGVNGRVLQGSRDNYAIGTGDTEFGEYPWQAAILRKEGGDNVFVCGGSLIDSRHILTAAHCIQSIRPGQLRIRLGDWDVGTESEFYPHQDFDAAAVAIHPDFNAGNLFNDIAIIKLDGYVELRQYPHISPICLPDKYIDFTGRRCIVTGWGKDAWGQEGKFQHRLKEVDLPVLNHYDCESKLRRTKLGSSFTLHQNFLCAGSEPQKDSCKGDGGGPLSCLVNNQWQLAGIVSWGVGCGQAQVPGVYFKVQTQLDWLRQNIG